MKRKNQSLTLSTCKQIDILNITFIQISLPTPRTWKVRLALSLSLEGPGCEEEEALTVRLKSFSLLQISN